MLALTFVLAAIAAAEPPLPSPQVATPANSLPAAHPKTAELAPPPLRDKMTFSLSVPPVAWVKVQPMLDSSVALVTLAQGPPDLEHQLMGWRDVHAFALPGAGQQVGIFVVLPDPIAQMRQTRRGNLVEIEVTTLHSANSLRERIKQGMPAPDVAREEGKLLADAEALLGGDSMTAARRTLTPLLSHYTIQPWVQLRLADVAFLEDGPQAACGLYDDVAQRFGDRNAGVIAALRMFALKCPQEQAPLVWTTLLKRTNTDDPTGRWLAEQAKWALQYADAVPQLVAALTWGEQVLGVPLYQRLLSRLLHIGTPLQVAEAGRAFAAAIGRHPDAQALRIFVGHSLCALDLQPQANKLAGPMLEPWGQSVRHCRSVGEPWPTRPNAQVQSLRRRLDQTLARSASVSAAAKSYLKDRP